MNVTVLRFQAGSQTYALAAGSVTSVATARADLPHVSEVIGDGTSSDSHDAARALRVSASGRTVDVVVDGPVELVKLGTSDVTPCALPSRAGVLGFARAGSQAGNRLTVLLDAQVLVERVLEFLRSGDEAR